MSVTENTTRNVESAIKNAALLFQKHPNCGSWKTTRPGALGGEVVAFTNKEQNFHRLSLRFYDQGEVDENGAEYDRPTWIVEKMDGEYRYDFQEEFFSTQREAVERIVEIMEDIEA